VLFRFGNTDWQKIRENKQFKFIIGLAVVLIILLVLFIDIFLSIYRFRIIKEEQPKIKKTSVVKVERPKKTIARVAIILDDAGGEIPNYANICSVKLPLTISVIPELGTSKKVAKAMADAGFEVMLHLPMEPKNGKYARNYGGMVLCSSDDNDINNIVKNDLSSVKYAVGFNNHMGSKATEDERVMRNIFSSIKGRGLYFIDSKTTERSVATKVARSYGFLCAANNIFLDGETSEANIELRFKQLISMAKNNGTAIGIGHATRPATINALKKLMPQYENDGIKFVYASELVK
jgi:hypothetical protein